MKKRLVVMNGQCLVQSELQMGQWKTEKVEKAGAIKPGIYNIHLASLADKTKTYEGLILHIDQDYVFHQVGENFIKNHRADLGELSKKSPKTGSNVCIKYDNDKAVMSLSPSSKT